MFERLFKFRKREPRTDAKPTDDTATHQAESDEQPQAAQDITAAHKFLSDAPLNDLSDDRFDRAPFARRVAETIINRTDHACLILGIFGPWGDGKTTVLNFIRRVLETDSDIACIAFNPWRIGGEDALLASFFSTLADGISFQLKTNTEKIGNLLKDYSFLLTPVPAGVNSMAAGVGSKLSSVSLEKLRTRIGAALRESDKRLVILVDDIDRLEKDEIQGLFRLIKLSADFENVMYVLAFDDAMVAAALGERYSSDPSKHSIAGQNFLEKLFRSV